jgi:hypothetical protein
MPKMTDSRRRKIQARQRQLRAMLSRERKAARRAQRSAKAGRMKAPVQADTAASTPGPG